MGSEDKVFDLLEKMFLEIQNVKSEMQTMQSEMQTVKSEVQTVKSEVQTVKSEVIKNQNSIVKLEEAFHNKIGILFDADQRTQEKLQQIEEKVDILQIDVNSLTAKTAHNESRIIELSRKAR